MRPERRREGCEGASQGVEVGGEGETAGEKGARGGRTPYPQQSTKSCYIEKIALHTEHKKYI